MLPETLAISLAVLAGPIVLLTREPSADGPYIVLTAPWTDPDDMLAKAEAWEVGTTPPAIGTMAWGEGQDLSYRLAQAGALFVLSGSPVNWLCGGDL
ncbi:hypothetical protein [Albirhodobacter sp. R86504]|uniref:hypothetical protein n=1 Tax=Albirhodobacter sp. R86504 TaxID=3093848 RepID=UPI0036733A80